MGMKWIIKIKNDKSKRIVVKYDLLNDVLLFIGQAYIHNTGWIEFSVDKVTTTEEIDLSVIQEYAVIAYNKMIERFEVYNNLKSGLEIIEAFDFRDDSEISEENSIIKTNEVYGNLEDVKEV